MGRSKKGRRSKQERNMNQDQPQLEQQQEKKQQMDPPHPTESMSLSPTCLSRNFHLSSDPYPHMSEKAVVLFELYKKESTTETAKENSFRQLLIESGTNVQLNEEDAMSSKDGDQSVPPNEAQRMILQKLWLKGHEYLRQRITKNRTLPEFLMHVVQGNAMKVQEELALLYREGMKAGVSPIYYQGILRVTLDRRYSQFRLSPLLVCLWMTTLRIFSMLEEETRDIHLGSFPQQGCMDYAGVAVALLRYGANPCVKDVFGKTVVHYGAGLDTTPESLKIAEYCIAAARFAKYLDGSPLVLDGLENNSELNGTYVVMTGFGPLKGRCLVAQTNFRNVPVAPEDQQTGRNVKKLSINPCNLYQMMPDGKCGCCIQDDQSTPELVNVPDRNGVTPLLEICKCYTWEYVLKFLVEKQKASLDIPDANGITVRAVIEQQLRQGDRVSHVLEKHVKNTVVNSCHPVLCGGCQRKEDTTTNNESLFPVCSVCLSVFYCGKECQRTDWQQHKKVCVSKARPDACIPLKKKPALSTKKQKQRKGSQEEEGEGKDDDTVCKLPKGKSLGDAFWVKIQPIHDRSSEDSTATPTTMVVGLRVQSKKKTCLFELYPTDSGYQEVMALLIEQEKSSTKQYRRDDKCQHFKASLNAVGECTIYPYTASSKAW